MASTSFRDSVNSLGWSRRDPDLPVRTNNTNSSFLSRLQSFNPFGQDQGYVQLPTHEAPGAPLPAANLREEEDSFLACKPSPSRTCDLFFFFATPILLLHHFVQVTVDFVPALMVFATGTRKKKKKN